MSTPLLSKNVIFVEQSAGNQRHINSLVGTSETLRAASFSTSFCEWLAGLIDGDGCLLVSKQGHTSCEISVGMADERCLRYIQNKLGGSIKARSGARAWRYRIHNRAGMNILINCINGRIRHSTRLQQLHRVCLKLNIEPLTPVTLTKNSHWFAGFFDADGTITYSLKNSTPQLTVSVTNKKLVDVEHFLILGIGKIYFDIAQNGYYKWTIQSREDILKIKNYFKECPIRSVKAHRVHLINRYFELRDIKAFSPSSPAHNTWLEFIKEWNKMMI